MDDPCDFPEKGVADLVKGISRRVIVVRSPDPRFFEQAIFLMKEDAFHNANVSADQVVAEARQAAAAIFAATPEAERHGGNCPVRSGFSWAAV